MPNWQANHWVIEAVSKECFDAVRDILEDENGDFTFNNLLPMPKILENTLAGSEFMEDGTLLTSGMKIDPEKEGSGYRPFTSLELFHLFHTAGKHKNWLSWQRCNWGVKWGPSEGSKVIKEDELRIEYIFDTPWGPPEQFAMNFRRWCDDLMERHDEDESWLVDLADWSYHLG